MSKDFKFDLGVTVKDIITGFKGVVRARCDYLTGCNTYGVQRKGLDKEGDVYTWKWLDEDQLVQTKSKIISIYRGDEKEKEEKRKFGGANSGDQVAPC